MAGPAGLGIWHLPEVSLFDTSYLAEPMLIFFLNVGLGGAE